MAGDTKATDKQAVLLAIVGAPHGVRGEVRLKPFTSDPMAVGDYGPLASADGRRFEVAALRPAKSMVVARLKGVADRSAAEALKGLELFVDRSALPDTLEDDEFYFSDLVGLDVFDDDGKSWGRITAVHDFGGGDLLEIAVPGRGASLIPFTRAAVPQIDVAKQTAIVDPVAAGLEDGPPDDLAPAD